MRTFRDAHLRDIVRTYKNYKSLGDRALAQVPDEHLHTELDPNSNSIAAIPKGASTQHTVGDFKTRGIAR